MRLTLGQLKEFVASIPSEFDEVEVNWVDFHNKPDLRVYADGAILLDEGDGGKITDLRPKEWI